MLPGIDGFQVCRELRNLSLSVGIIILTARTQEEEKMTLGLVMAGFGIGLTQYYYTIANTFQTYAELTAEPGIYKFSE